MSVFPVPNRCHSATTVAALDLGARVTGRWVLEMCSKSVSFSLSLIYARWRSAKNDLEAVGLL